MVRRPSSNRGYIGPLIEVDGKALVEQRQRRNPPDLQSGEALGIGMAGHVDFLGPDGSRRHFEVERAIGGHQDQHRLETGVIGLDHQCLVDVLRRQTGIFRHFGSVVDDIGERHDLVGHILPLQDAHG